jgi:hypothetical protein
MLHYPPPDLSHDKPTRAVRDFLATAMVTLGAILNVAWIGLLIVMVWRLLELAS